MQLGEQAGLVVALALDDLDGKRFVGYLTHRLDGRLADLLDYVVLVELACEALRIHYLPHQILPGLNLREKQSEAFLPLLVQAADGVHDERRFKLLARRRREAHCVGRWLESDQHFAKI